jgi:hypothetical protein
MNIYIDTKEMKCHCYEEVWKKIVKTLGIHWRNKIVGRFGNTEKQSRIQLWLKDKGCFDGFR